MPLLRVGTSAPKAWAALGFLLLAGCTTATESTTDVGTQAHVNELAAREALPGRKIYDDHCAACHDGTVKKAPERQMVGLMTPEAIVASLTKGLMSEQGSNLTERQRILVAEYLAGAPLGTDDTPKPPACSGNAARFDYAKPPRLTNWGLTAGNTHRVPDSVSRLRTEDATKLKLRWAFAFPGANRARSQPGIAGGAIYVGSHNGLVYALDRETGCVRWAYESGAEVRTGVVLDSWTAGDVDARPRAYFGDVLGNVHAIDAITGEAVWRIRADEHPNATITGTPSLHEGRLYVPVSSLEVSLASDPTYECCKGRGSVVALDSATGRVIWKTYTIGEAPVVQSQNRSQTDMYGPSGAMVWSSPAIDAKRRQLYVGTAENMSSPATETSDAILALDLDSGKIRWVFQATANDAWNTACDTERPDSCPEENGPDFDFGAAIMLLPTDAFGELVIGGQKSGVVHALKPDTGKLVWQSRAGRGGIQGGVHFGIAGDSDSVYVPITDMADGRTYPDPARPGLHALDPNTGAEIWYSAAPDVCRDREFCHPGVSQAITVAAGLVFAGGMDGVLRIHDAADGTVLRKVDTTLPVETVSGETASGGSFGGSAAPVVEDGTLIVSSGYGIYQHMPGNVLLVFDAE